MSIYNGFGFDASAVGNRIQCGANSLNQYVSFLKNINI